MRSLIVLSALFVLACSPPATTVEPAAPPPQTSVEPSSDPWPMFQWLGGSEGERAWLYFGPDESDNIHMYFECAPHSGRTMAEAFDPGREGSRLVLSSGDARGVFPATPQRDESGDIFGDAVKSRATIEVSHPVLVEFGRTGILAAGDPSESFRTATQDELARIQSFLALCASR